VVKELMAAGVRCGVATNDQARGLVDTQVMEAVGMSAVAEVAGGCFCCKLEDFVGNRSTEPLYPAAAVCA
jgi:hypothetical protein